MSTFARRRCRQGHVVREKRAPEQLDGGHATARGVS
jgi:hypothetical protein